MSLPRVPRSRLRPKLRSIPRAQSESSLYAELQQLSVERQRLLQELDYIAERKDLVTQRLQELEGSIKALQGQVGISSEPAPKTSPLPTTGNTFSPIVFEY